MKFFDYVFCEFYLFFNRTLKRRKEDAKLSAVSFLSLYIALFLNVLNNTIGLVYNNNITYYFTEKKTFLISYFGIMVFCYLIFGIRYYKLYDTNKIIENNYINHKRFVLKYITICMLIAIPVLSFITFRLYKFGYI